MLDYFILAVTAISLIFVFLLLKNNRKQRIEIKAHLEKIKKLKKDSKDYLDIYD
ncbi:MAG: hypothetical protein WBL27_06830 [Salinimicrobium sp.]